MLPNENREFRRAAHKTEGRRAAKKGGPVGFSATRRPAIMCSSLACPVVQPASLQKIHVIYLEARPSV